MSTQVKTLRPAPLVVGEDVGISPGSLFADNALISPNTIQKLVSVSNLDKVSDMLPFGGSDYDNAAPSANTQDGFFSESEISPSSYIQNQAQIPNGLPDASELPMLSGQSFDSHNSFMNNDLSYSSYTDQSSRGLPDVVSFSPSQGHAGRKIHVYLNSRTEDLETSITTFTVSFGSYRCDAALARLAPQQNQQANYVLEVEVPAFESIQSSISQVTLTLGTTDSDKGIEFGQFTYVDASELPRTPDSSLGRKRKLSLDTSVQSSKRATTNPLSGGYSTSSTPNQGSSPYSSGPQSANYAYATQTPPRPRQLPSSTQSTPRYGISPSVAAAHLGVGPSSAVYGHVSYGSDGSVGPTSSPLSQSAVSNITNGSSAPALVRTSTLQYDSSSPHSVSSGYNPYSMYSSNNKAVLKLEGDLNSMADNWTQTEISTQRRLIRFRRSQTGSNINATFEPVTQEDHARAPGHIYVSCIWWAEKQACFITSVDTIQLLESLVAVRFTVEEKNRIRRNLEGFRPATVSKTRPDCEEFFKTIMGFPSPKPRNIEKDVKVFPWRILAGALKKIIGKYSASYSSSAASVPASTMGNINPATGASNMGHMRHHSSSRSATPQGGMQYIPQPYGVVPSNAGTPPQPQMSTQHVNQGMGQNMSWHQPAAHYTTNLSGAGARQNWDFAAGFMDGASGMMPQHQQGGVQYERPMQPQNQMMGYMSY